MKLLKRLRDRLWFWWNFRIRGMGGSSQATSPLAGIRRFQRNADVDRKIVAEWLAEAEAEGLDMSHKAITLRLHSEFEQGDWDNSIMMIESDRDDWVDAAPTPQELLFQRSLRA